MERAAFVNLFNDDAFTVESLSTTISDLPTVPGMAGKFAFEFEGVSDGIETTSAVIERDDEDLLLIHEQPRGAPPEIELKDKAELLRFVIPHIPLEASVRADEVQDVREFGTNNPQTVEYVVNKYLRKMNRRHDLTLEHLRLGAIKGEVIGASGATLVDLYAELGVTNSLGQHAPETFDFDLLNTGPSNDMQSRCMEVQRFMRRNAKMPLPIRPLVMAFCGDSFFDMFIRHPSVRNTYAGTAAAAERLGGDVTDAFEFCDIVFVNYKGTDDNSTVAIADHEARFFYSGVPGIFAEYYAPADFIDTVNTRALPRYARIAIDPKFQRWVTVHTQQNPLPLCLRPKTLVRAISGA